MENRPGGRAGTEGTKAKPGDTGGPASSRDKSEFSEGPEGSGRLRGLPFPHALAPGPPSPLHSAPRALRQEEEVWVQPSLRAPIRSRRAGEKGRRPLSPFHRSPDFPCHAPAASDLGSGGRLSWKRPPFHSYGSWGCPGGGVFRDQPAGVHNLPVGISAAAERSNSRSRSRSPGGAAAAATAAAAAHWDPLGSTALAMSGTCLRLAAVAASRARADS